MKLLFVIPGLAWGGIERFLVTLLQHLGVSGNQITLVMFAREGEFLADLRPDIRVVEIPRSSARSFPRLWWTVRSFLRQEQFDVAVGLGMLPNLCLLAACIGQAVRPAVMLTEHDIPADNTEPSLTRRVKWFLVRKLYPRAEAIISVSTGVEASLAEDFGIPLDRSRVIPPPVDLERIALMASEPSPFTDITRPYVVSVGRLSTVKDHATLVRAFARIANDVHVDLVIVGEGPEHANLVGLIRDLNLEGRVHLTGFLANPYPVMGAASVYVSSSRSEGFGIVLVEAMTLGVPLVATACPGGPVSMLRDGKDGVLVPVGDVPAMSDAIRHLLENEDARAELGRRGKVRAGDFSAGTVAAEYRRRMEQASQEHKRQLRA